MLTCSLKRGPSADTQRAVRMTGERGSTQPCSGDAPAMCQEAAADMTRAVTARRGAGHALCLARLPRELDTVEVTVLLSLGCYGAS